MSNKIVPQIYRVVIDDVIRSIKPEFDEYGVSEDVLAELQHKWESKVIASHVAEFEPPPPQPVPPHHPTHPSVAPQQHNPQPHPAYPPHPIHHGHPQYYYTPQPPPPPPPGPQVKTEPVDSRYMLNAPPQTSTYTLPSLPGPPISGPGVPPRPGGQVISFQGTPPTARYPGNAQSIAPQKNGATNGRIPQTDGPSASSSMASSSRIPQVDGPSSSSSSGSPSPPPAAYAPRGTAHPSLPQPSQTRTDDGEGDEAINSDLDDSDSDNEKEDVEGTGGEIDIVFCTYDKVARVKNKWKCVLKDGMIHVNGKDYLFAKCTGEFEW
ncbi:transcription factor IIA, alpha/beta subunit-domain-containing protein [Irpex lacteus]|nr:transcription factor IIA, alpha/beta subunit-domain-containing protein [Irpex lacteus]